ncbi:hypothetical protein [Streptomyces sp. NPDC048659]|uniref:hypothetical protein n=1 Tax=Streptomyces sp. NPDC048659 TaxID=3155489 RepID=UPI00343743DE
MIAILLTPASLCAQACALALILLRPHDRKTGAGASCIANALAAAARIPENPPLAGVFAGVAAYFAWLWWHSGGGDDTKRRLRSWARAFTPVRRTAPIGA